MHTDKLTLGIMQIDIIDSDVDRQLDSITNTVKSIDAQCDLIVLPETFATGFVGNPLSVSEEDNGRIFTWMKNLSQHTGSSISGSIFTKEGSAVYNSFFLVNSDGSYRRYDKHHLFRMSREGQLLAPGTKRITINLNGWRIRPIVCYDLRFPVWCRNIVGDEAAEYDILICSACWPSSRQSAWDTLLRARAIENQSYVCGINRVGCGDTGVLYTGGSVIYAPDGKQIFFAGDSASGTIHTITREPLRTVRENFPAYLDADRFIFTD
jgi:predicted amidohydrolase